MVSSSSSTIKVNTNKSRIISYEIAERFTQPLAECPRSLSPLFHSTMNNTLDIHECSPLEQEAHLVHRTCNPCRRHSFHGGLS